MFKYVLLSYKDGSISFVLPLSQSKRAVIQAALTILQQSMPKGFKVVYSSGK